MHEDLYDTVVVPPRRDPQPDTGIDEDTIVPAKQGERAVAAGPSGLSSMHAAEAPATAPTRASRDVHSRASEAGPRAFVEPSPSVTPVRATAKRQAATSAHPALIEPPPARPRRVPLTHQRVQETLRAPEAAHEPSVLSPVHPVAPAPVYGFRMGDRAPISLDVPALIGRKPAAPRIPGKVFPRLVRVPSPLNEVSGTHLELRQEGTSVIVTDLRSTNGTVVRMPGSRPIKLRQGESLVVRPGTLVDIGDGNVFEILPPPRLSVAEDASGDGMWV